MLSRPTSHSYMLTKFQTLVPSPILQSRMICARSRGSSWRSFRVACGRKDSTTAAKWRARCRRAAPRFQRMMLPGPDVRGRRHARPGARALGRPSARRGREDRSTTYSNSPWLTDRLRRLVASAVFYYPDPAMRKVLLYSVLLVAGLIGSQVVPPLLGDSWAAIAVALRVATMVALAFIMIHVGYEFEIDRSRPGGLDEGLLGGGDGGGLPLDLRQRLLRLRARCLRRQRVAAPGRARCWRGASPRRPRPACSSRCSRRPGSRRPGCSARRASWPSSTTSTRSC